MSGNNDCPSCGREVGGIVDFIHGHGCPEQLAFEVAAGKLVTVSAAKGPQLVFDMSVAELDQIRALPLLLTVR